MIRRYDLRRSDNFPFVGRKSYRCIGSGSLSITTGFPVTSAMVTWSSIPVFNQLDEYSSTSSSSADYSSDSSISSAEYSSDSSISSIETSSSSSIEYSSDSSGISSVSQSSIEFSSDSSESSVEYSSESSGISSLSPESLSSASLSSLSSSSVGTSSSSSSTSSNAWHGDFSLPRLYISEYTNSGFVVKYENIPEEIGYFEFSYIAF